MTHTNKKSELMLINHLCGPLWFWLAEGCVKREVEEVPPALANTVLASSNMKWAEASEG